MQFESNLVVFTGIALFSHFVAFPVISLSHFKPKTGIFVAIIKHNTTNNDEKRHVFFSLALNLGQSATFFSQKTEVNQF